MQISKPTDIPHACQLCSSKRCQYLFWEDSLVYRDIFEVPLNCPMRVKDENLFARELEKLQDCEVSSIFGEIVVRHDWDIRCSQEKHDWIKYLVLYFKQNRCTMIARSQNPEFKPWTMHGFYEHIKPAGTGPVLPKVESKDAKEQ